MLELVSPLSLKKGLCSVSKPSQLSSCARPRLYFQVSCRWFPYLGMLLVILLLSLLPAFLVAKWKEHFCDILDLNDFRELVYYAKPQIIFEGPWPCLHMVLL